MLGLSCRQLARERRAFCREIFSFLKSTSAWQIRIELPFQEGESESESRLVEDLTWCSLSCKQVAIWRAFSSFGQSTAWHLSSCFILRPSCLSESVRLKLREDDGE